MPRRTHRLGVTRRVYKGEAWKGRHRLDHEHVPKVIRKLIEADDRPAGSPGRAAGGNPATTSPDHA